MGCDTSIRIGGAAGQGMNVISTLLGRVFVREGFWVFIYHDLMSRIRGGHNFSQVRISDKPVRTLSGKVDILVCFDKKTLDMYKDEVQGPIIYDSVLLGENKPSDKKHYPLPLGEIAKNVGKNPKMENTVASGAVMALLGLSLEGMYNFLSEAFKDKGNEVIEANKNCVKAGYEYILQNYKSDFTCTANLNDKSSKKMFMTGSEAIALGALNADIKFYSAYPMSPSTPVLEYLAENQKDFGIVVEQAEDEIAAINMAIGASFAGVRAMTGTSGGGLALMVEGISLIGMTETSLVILDGQRPGPATGFPTRTEQGDLLFVAHCGHGEFPRVILAPATAEEAFYLTTKAFYLAEKYQIPVFILGDQYLNDSSWTVEKFNTGNIPEGRQSFLSEDDLKKMPAYQYRRYEVTESGISPMIIPGTPGQVVYADSDEHTLEGHITESAQVRNMMVEKRLRKLEGLRKEISLPKIFPDLKAEAYIVCWGSTLVAVEEAVNMLRQKGINIGYIHFSEVYPLKKEAIPAEILRSSKLIAVENNATGQFAKLLRMETGLDIQTKILKYDGRPFSPQELVEKIESVRRSHG